RGQLQKAESIILMARLSPSNEVPSVDMDAAGVAHVMVTTTRDSSGALTSGQLIFDLNYRFPGQETFVGFHIHPGRAGSNGGVIFNTGIGGGATSVQSDPSGVGNLRRPVEVNMSKPDEVAALDRLFNDPSAFYINLHTPAHPGGVFRSQLHGTDLIRFPVT